jgi:hypothetical protein
MAFVFTYDFFIEHQNKVEAYATAQSDQEKAGKILENLDKVKVESQKNSTELQKYIQEFREDVIYEKVFSLMGTDGKIGSISIDRGETLTSGLTLTNIQFSFESENLDNVLSFLDRATDATGKQRYLVKSFAFPFASANVAPISASVSLGIYTIK